MLEKDYKRLYRLQNNVLDTLKDHLNYFYLTGGTALGRFYLNHRYSDDLDFFTNNFTDFKIALKEIENILRQNLELEIKESIISQNYAKFIIENDNAKLKIDFVNDVPYRSNKPLKYKYGFLDSLLNIFSNKIGAIISRDEPKDVFDVYFISMNFNFNWKYVFYEAKSKTLISEIEFIKRLDSFPIALLEKVDWFFFKPDFDKMQDDLKIISNDFFTGSDNSLAKEDADDINEAKIIYF